MDQSKRQDELELREAKVNLQMNCTNTAVVTRKALYLLIMIFLVYFLEYISFQSMASELTKYYKRTEPVDTPKVILYLFEILNLAYQCGVFTTRSTLDLFRIKKIHFVIAFLFIFSTLMFVQTVVHHEWGVIWVIANTYLVGFFGGLAFGNICYLLFELETIQKSEKELLVNIFGMFCDFGVIFSSLIGLVLKTFIYPA